VSRGCGLTSLLFKCRFPVVRLSYIASCCLFVPHCHHYLDLLSTIFLPSLFRYSLHQHSPCTPAHASIRFSVFFGFVPPHILAFLVLCSGPTTLDLQVKYLHTTAIVPRTVTHCEWRVGFNFRMAYKVGPWAGYYMLESKTTPLKETRLER